jgi:iron complex outermembrane receptor protein
MNVITRRGGARLHVDLSAGQHALLDASATVGTTRGRVDHVVSGSIGHSRGFMPARDHDIKLARYQATFRRDTTLALGVVDKEFGANGFYGPAPSREWTDQLLATVHHRYAHADRWHVSADASFRTHGDRFVYDGRTPGLSENRHRTHAIAAHVRWHGVLSHNREISAAAGGGRDTIESSNLGDHDFSRGSLAVEMRQRFGTRVVLHPGLRVDTYSRFGTSWNPSISAVAWTSERVKLRASSGRAFRVPTFTELFYTDPNHQGAGALSPETAWSADAGADYFRGLWGAGITLFARWEDNVIDWVRPSAAVRWRTTNIRDVRTRGLETSLRRRLDAGRQLGLQYTWLEAQAPALDLLSKYALDYAPHSVAAFTSNDWKDVRLGARAEWKRRIDGRAYWVLDVQLARAIRRAELYVQATNLLDQDYEEIRGVEMPGRWFKVGVRLR